MHYRQCDKFVVDLLDWKGSFTHIHLRRKVVSGKYFGCIFALFYNSFTEVSVFDCCFGKKLLSEARVAASHDLRGRDISL